MVCKFKNKRFIKKTSETNYRQDTYKCRWQRCQRRKFTNKSFWIASLLAAIVVSLCFWYAPALRPSAEEIDSGYVDVDDSNKHYEDISVLASAGIFEGTDCDTDKFCPDADLDRRTLLIWLIKMMEAEDSLHWVEKRGWTHLVSELDFKDEETDLSQDEIAEQMVMWGLSLGCRRMTMDECLDQSVYRKHMAPFLVHAFRVPAADSTAYADVGAKNKYLPAISRLTASEIVKPCSEDPLKYCPRRTVTRAQMASLLVQADIWQNSSQETPTNLQSTPAPTEELDESGELAVDPPDELEELAANPPDMPTSVSLVLNGQNGITVSWQAPTDGGQITHYRLNWRISEATAAWTQSPNIAATTLTGAISNLIQGKTYEVIVEAFNDDGSATSDALEIQIPIPPPSQPRNVRVNSLSAGQFAVNWKESLNGGNDSSLKYAIQWREKHQSFSNSRRQLVSPADLTSTGTAPNRIFSLTLNKNNVYMVRVSAISDGGTAAATEVLVPIKSNRVVRHMERGIVAQYEDEYPWLTEVWNYMKGPDFTVGTDNIRGAWVDVYWLSGYPLDTTEAQRMVVYNGWIGNNYLDIYAHEMAHVYTLTNGIADEPAPLAMAHLYFSQLANQSSSNQCWAEELYADAAAVMIFPSGSDYYWTTSCSGYNRPPAEAIEVVKQAFRGQTPDWFYDTYQDSDGNIDLEAVWNDVKAMQDSWYRRTVAYQLRDAFGGYCDAYQAGRSASGWDRTVRNPWRDDGCVPTAPQDVTATAGDGSIAVSWQPPAYDGGQDLTGYVIEWKKGRQEYSSSRRLDVDDTTQTVTIDGLSNNTAYTVRVSAINGLDDGDFWTWDDGLGISSDEVTARPDD